MLITTTFETNQSNENSHNNNSIATISDEDLNQFTSTNGMTDDFDNINPIATISSDDFPKRTNEDDDFSDSSSADDNSLATDGDGVSQNNNGGIVSEDFSNEVDIPVLDSNNNNNNSNINNYDNNYHNNNLINYDDIIKNEVEALLSNILSNNKNEGDDVETDNENKDEIIDKLTLHLKKYILMKRSVKRIGLIKFMQFCYDKVEKIVPELHKHTKDLDNSLGKSK